MFKVIADYINKAGIFLLKKLEIKKKVPHELNLFYKKELDKFYEIVYEREEYHRYFTSYPYDNQIVLLKLSCNEATSQRTKNLSLKDDHLFWRWDKYVHLFHGEGPCCAERIRYFQPGYTSQVQANPFKYKSNKSSK